MIFGVFSLVSSGPGAFAKIRACAHGSTVVDRTRGAIVLDRNSQRGSQRSWPPVRCSRHQVDWGNVFRAPLVVVSPLSTTGRGASGSGSLRTSKIQNTHFQISIFIFFEMVQKIRNVTRLLSDRPFNRRQKYETFLLEAFETPHPRFNDVAKPDGVSIIELGVRGIAKNWKIIM